GPSDDTLAILGPPVLVTDGSIQLTLTCQASDVNPPDLRYTWFGTGVVCDGGNTGSTCSFRPQPLWDDGKDVTCRATNDAGQSVVTASAVFRLNLTYYASVTLFTINDSRNTLVANASDDVAATLRCEAAGQPTPDLKLTLEGKELLNVTRNTSSGFAGISHMIPRLTCPDMGTYACTADNGFKDRESREVVVYCAPKLSHPNEDPPELTDKGLAIILVANPVPDTFIWENQQHDVGNFTDDVTEMFTARCLILGIGLPVLLAVVILIIYFWRRRIQQNRRYEKPRPRDTNENPYDEVLTVEGNQQTDRQRHTYVNSSEPARASGLHYIDATNSQQAPDDKDPTFFFLDDWGHKNGLSAKTVDILRCEEVTTPHALSMLTTEDIKSLCLKLGQRKLLERAVGLLAERLTTTHHSDGSAGKTPETCTGAVSDDITSVVQDGLHKQSSTEADIAIITQTSTSYDG
ncbi:hypothetical protein BaRGS_00038896, partial [Batillaria attramentaria]